MRDVVAFILPSNRTRCTVRVTTQSLSISCVVWLQSTNATLCTVARMDAQSINDASSCTLALLPFCGRANHLLIIRIGRNPHRREKASPIQRLGDTVVRVLFLFCRHCACSLCIRWHPLHSASSNCSSSSSPFTSLSSSSHGSRRWISESRRSRHHQMGCWLLSNRPARRNPVCTITHYHDLLPNAHDVSSKYISTRTFI